MCHVSCVTQSPSVSNNPKIPTYYLIFAVLMKVMFIGMRCLRCENVLKFTFLMKSLHIDKDIVSEYFTFLMKALYIALYITPSVATCL